MEYKEYLEKYNYAYGHESFEDGEHMEYSLVDLLETLKERRYECPDYVDGGIPVKIKIDPESAVEDIEETLWDNEFSGEDYEISTEGRDFLMECFEEYNEKYANNGYYCETVKVRVPDEMKYELPEVE